MTGQRVITALPSNQGGAAAVGPSGLVRLSFNTKCQLPIFDIVIYVGCGERGNEMTRRTQIISERNRPSNWPVHHAADVLIANLNIPVAARGDDLHRVAIARLP